MAVSMWSNLERHLVYYVVSIPSEVSNQGRIQVYSYQGRRGNEEEGKGRGQWWWRESKQGVSINEHSNQQVIT